MSFLEVPYVFTRTGTLPRGRTTVHQRLHARAIVRVPDITGDMAPVVARASYPTIAMTRGGDGAIEWIEAMHSVDYRMLEGRLVRRAVADASMLCTQGGNTMSLPSRLSRLASHNAVQRHPVETAIMAGWLEDPGSIGPQSADLLMELLAANLTGRPSPMQSRMAFGDLPPAETSPILPNGQDGLAHKTGDDQHLRARETRQAVEGACAFVDGALYLPSMGPGWTAHSYMGVRVVPEAGWINAGNLGSFYCAGDLAGRESFRCANHIPNTPVGTIELLDGYPVDVHPDEYLARHLARLAYNPGMAAALAGLQSRQAMHALLRARDLVDQPQPCAIQVGAELAYLADVLDANPGLPLVRIPSSMLRQPIERALARATILDAAPLLEAAAARGGPR